MSQCPTDLLVLDRTFALRNLVPKGLKCAGRRSLCRLATCLGRGARPRACDGPASAIQEVLFDDDGRVLSLIVIIVIYYYIIYNIYIILL